MQRRFSISMLLAAVVVAGGGTLQADEANFTRTRNVIYGRKHGLAMTMDVFAPKKDRNGAGLVFTVSGGWFSSQRAIRLPFCQEFLNRGYTVFAVVHGSQPRFTIPECVADMNRAVRFIRHNAKKYEIDANRIGIYGASAGGHLSLMIGTAGDRGNPNAADAVERASSRVQAVACFFPPTDFLNYGKPGAVMLGTGTLKNFRAPFDFTEFDNASRRYRLITDDGERKEIGRKISPVTFVSKEDPPTLIIHGDADNLVPIQQAELIVAKMEKAGVTAKLVTRKGAAHGWATLGDDLKLFADWFDEHLKPEDGDR